MVLLLAGGKPWVKFKQPFEKKQFRDSTPEGHICAIARGRQLSKRDCTEGNARPQTSSRSDPRFVRKKYAAAPITIAKKATTPARIAKAPGSTLAPATAANRCDQMAA
jgi:hypothetical protein